MLKLQVVAVQLFPELADAGVHELTRVGDVLEVLQVMVVKLFPELAVCGEQLAVPLGPTVLVEQVVRLYPLPEFGDSAVQLATNVGPVFWVEHVTKALGVQVGVKLQSSVLASHDVVCDVLLLTCVEVVVV